MISWTRLDIARSDVAFVAEALRQAGSIEPLQKYCFPVSILSVVRLRDCNDPRSGHKGYNFDLRLLNTRPISTDFIVLVFDCAPKHRTPAYLYKISEF